MAILAVFGGRSVVEDLLPFKVLHQFVAVAATDVLVGARERELGTLIVIESRWLPLRAVVTIGARSYLTFGELPSVRIGMALLALQRGLGEIRVDQLGAQVRRFVAIDTRHRAMGPDQRELGLCMVEACQILPVFRGMTGLASDSRSIAA